MKRSSLIAVAALIVSLTTVNSAKACCYVPWLDPLAWLGFYGCGYGCCGHGGYGYMPPYAYAPPAYSAYAPAQPYRVAAGPACDCNGVPQAAAVTPTYVPATAYRPVTQYVPQTTYMPSYQQNYGANVAYPSYPGSVATQSALPSTNVAMLPQNNVYAAPGLHVPHGTVYGPPTVSGPLPAGASMAPTISGPVMSGDVFGDHEVPVPSPPPSIIQSSYVNQVPLRRASYGVTPQAARSYRNVAR